MRRSFVAAHASKLLRCGNEQFRKSAGNKERKVRLFFFKSLQNVYILIRQIRLNLS